MLLFANITGADPGWFYMGKWAQNLQIFSLAFYKISKSNEIILVLGYNRAFERPLSTFPPPPSATPSPTPPHASYTGLIVRKLWQSVRRTETTAWPCWLKAVVPKVLMNCCYVGKGWEGESGFRFCWRAGRGHVSILSTTSSLHLLSLIVVFSASSKLLCV